MSNNKNILKTVFLLISLCFTITGFCGVSEAHILVIGDSNSDLPDFYAEALQISTDLKSRGYSVVELYRNNATAENILKGMYNADCVIYVGHGGYQTGHYDMNGGIATPPFALVGSDNFIWGINDQMREGWDSNLFYAPYKQDIPVFLLHACFSTGWVEDKQVANPIETIYNFAHMFTGSGANYYATAWNGAEIIYDFLNGAATFQVANNQNYEKIITSTLYNNTLVWRNNNGYAAFVGDWNGTFPTVAQTTPYNATAATAWYNSDRQIHQLTCNFSVNPTTRYSGELLNFIDNSTDIGSTIITYFWDFGDGTTSNAINPTHVYTTPGNYLVKHNVSDNYGLVAQSNLTLSILGNNSALYVSGLLGNDTWDGTSSTWMGGTIGPLKTIQSALNLVNGGGTVNVAPGTYTENIIINKKVNLTGSGAVNTTIRASSNDLSTIEVKSNASGTNITGFHVTGANASTGLYLNNAQNCTVKNNNITNNSIGVLDTGGSNNIDSNTVEDNGWAGVCLDDADNTQITNNQIENNSEGVYITGNSTNNTIKKNNITQNKYNGVNIRNSNKNQITSNKIISNGNNPEFSQGNGVILYQSLQNVLENNTIEYNGWAGIVLDNSSQNNLTSGQGSNTISENGNGLVLYGSSSQNIITGNNIINNLYNGLQLFSGCEYNQIRSNQINNNQVTGLLAQLSDNNNITSNNVSNSNYNGIALDNSDKNNIAGNTILFSGSIGIILVTSNSNTLIQNEVSSTFWTGIATDQSSYNLIQENTINGTGISQNGIWFQSNCNYNNITSNIITENTANGVYIQSSSGNLINYNNISLNAGGVGIGLLLVDTSSTAVNHNTFQDNGWVGTCVASDSSGNTITENNYISTMAQVSQTYDAGTNIYDIGSTGNYWSDWISTDPRPIDGGSNVDNHPSTTIF